MELWSSFLTFGLLSSSKGNLWIQQMNISQYNRDAWNREVAQGNKWTIPVSTTTITDARKGKWIILLTPSKPVPSNWFPELKGLDALCLASGGGQQGPILAAAGANVTVLDNSPKQLEQDRLVATRESISLVTVEGDMADLSAFDDEAFDLIVHPVSNIFIPDVQPVWSECFRVLRRGGVLMSGLANPAIYLFDYKLADEKGILKVKYVLPYSDIKNLERQELNLMMEREEPVEFSHTLEELIGGQLKAGFIITDFYEDSFPTEDNDLLSKYMQAFIATRAVKT